MDCCAGDRRVMEVRGVLFEVCGRYFFFTWSGSCGIVLDEGGE